MRGIYSALLGAFDSDGKVDVQGVHELVRHNIAFCHVDGLYVNGSNRGKLLDDNRSQKADVEGGSRSCQW